MCCCLVNNNFYGTLLRSKENRRQAFARAHIHTHTQRAIARRDGERTMLENIQQKANRGKKNAHEREREPKWIEKKKQAAKRNALSHGPEKKYSVKEFVAKCCVAESEME